jgi:hypothetical protein
MMSDGFGLQVSWCGVRSSNAMTKKAPRKTATYELVKSPALRFNKPKKIPIHPRMTLG